MAEAVVRHDQGRLEQSRLGANLRLPAQMEKAAPKGGLSSETLGVPAVQHEAALRELMQVAALFMALAMVCPRKIAAAAMAAPTMARIKAYSAAEAPSCSFK
jgi:hypothetical protein